MHDENREVKLYTAYFKVPNDNSWCFCGAKEFPIVLALCVSEYVLRGGQGKCQCSFWLSWP